MKQQNDDTIGRFLLYLTLIFIFFKLYPASIIQGWSWWAVLAPIWGPFLFLFITLVITFLYVFIMNAGKQEKMLLTDKEKLGTRLLGLLLTALTLFAIFRQG